MFTWEGSPRGFLSHGVWDLPGRDAARFSLVFVVSEAPLPESFVADAVRRAAERL